MDDDLYQDIHPFGEVARTSHNKDQNHTERWKEMTCPVEAWSLRLFVSDIGGDAWASQTARVDSSLEQRHSLKYVLAMANSFIVACDADQRINPMGPREW